MLRYRSTLTPVLITVALVASMPLAMKSLLLAGAIAAVMVLAILIGGLGLERTSVLMMILAFALAPADKWGVSFLGVSDVFFFVSLGLAVPRLLRTPVRLPNAFVLASLVFVTVGVLSCVSANSFDIYSYTARVIFMFVVLPALVVWWAPRGRVLVWLLVAYGAGTGVSVIWGIPEIGAYRNYGLTQHPNVLGYTAMLTVSLIPFLYLALTAKWRLWICGSIVAVAGVGIVTSGSRAALLVVIVLAILVPAVERSIPLALIVATAGVIAVGAIGQRSSPTEGQDALSRLLGAGDVSGSDRARINGVEQTWDVAVAHPWFGAGFRLTEFNGHNVYVQVAAAVGFIGLAAFLVLLSSMVKPIFATDNINSRLLYPAIAFIGAGPVSPQLTDRYVGLLLGIALVGVNAIYAERQSEGESEELGPPRLLRLNR